MTKMRQRHPARESGFPSNRTWVKRRVTSIATLDESCLRPVSDASAWICQA